MASRLGEIPERTRELVELQRYLNACINETTPVLHRKIAIAARRVLFLLDCTVLPAEDLQLNTRVFQWPRDMASVFELAKTRTGHRRDQVRGNRSLYTQCYIFYRIQVQASRDLYEK